MDCSAFQGSHSLSCRFATASWNCCRRGTAAFHENETLDDIHKTDPLGNIRHWAWDWSSFGCSRSSRSWTENSSLLQRSSPDVAKQPFPKPCRVVKDENAACVHMRLDTQHILNKKHPNWREWFWINESYPWDINKHILHTKKTYIRTYYHYSRGKVARVKGGLPLVVGNSFWKVWPKAQPWVWPRKCWSIKETPFKNFQKNFGMNES